MLDRAYIDLTSPIGRGFMAFISAMAEDERLRIIKRTHEGRAIARENGVKMGRKFRRNDVPRIEARQRAGQRRGHPSILPTSLASAAQRSIAQAHRSELDEGTGRLSTCP